MHRPRHRRVEDRFYQAVHPCDEFIVALWNLAIYQTWRDRRRERQPRRDVWRVDVNCRANQGELLAAFVRHCVRNRRPPEFLSFDSVTRHTAAARRVGLIVVRRGYPVIVRGVFKQEPNLYGFTRSGKLWIKKHSTGVTWRSSL